LLTGYKGPEKNNLNEFEDIQVSKANGLFEVSFKLKPSLSSLKMALGECSLVAVAYGSYLNNMFAPHSTIPQFTQECYQITNFTTHTSPSPAVNYTAEFRVTLTVALQWTEDYNNKSSASYQTLNRTIINFVSREGIVVHSTVVYDVIYVFIRFEKNTFFKVYKFNNELSL
jgi:hypothetical protein